MLNNGSPLVRRGAMLVSACVIASTSMAAADAAGVASTPLFQVGDGLLHALVVLAVVQVIFIVALAGILRTLGGPGGWVKKLAGRSGRVIALAPLLLLAGQAQAQAYKGDGNTMSAYGLFWWLAALNLLLFVLLMVQIRLVRTLLAVVSGAQEETTKPVAAEGPSWLDRTLRKLTRQVGVEEEQAIELHHDYDGIKELDNVLPPWWLWLFYGTIAWGVVYLVNVHVIEVWPQQGREYNEEMAQAKADIEAYMATLTNTVDESSVTFTDDAATVASGRALFTQFCTPCHGADAAGSETSVGPNLTDAYWLHGGGVKNVFRTIKYGVPEKGMISWKSQLQPAEIRSIACYILGLQASGPATQKAPQGELWKEEALPSDSTGAAVDTVRVAMR